MARNISVYIGPASDSPCMVSVYRLRQGEVSRRSYVNLTAASERRVLRWIESQGDGIEDEDGVVMSEGRW